MDKRTLRARGGRRARLLRGVAGMAAALALCVATQAVRAQEIARELGSALTPVPRDLIEKSRNLLSLDDDQFEIVKDLFQGYRAAYRTMIEESDAKRKQFFEKARANSDWAGADTKSRDLMKKTLADLQRLDTTFMDDVRAILSGNQLAQFENFERTKRRESSRHSSMLSGEGADPLDILASLKIDPTTLADYPVAAADYAEALDRQIQARAQIWKAGYDAYLAGDDWQRLRDDYPKLYVVSKQIRDVNRRVARQIAEMLPEADKARFEDEFRRRSYPQIYNEGVIAKRLKAARGAEGLTDFQKEELEIAEHAYERDSEHINAKWRSSLDRAQDLIVAQGKNAWSSSEAQSVRETAEERKQLDRKYLDTIDKILTEEQVGRLPATSREMPKFRGDAMPDWDRDAVRKWLKDDK